MPFMQWTGLLTIDGALVDEQHRGLFDAINAFHEAVTQGHESEVVANLLDYLHAYGLRHFSDEEALLNSAHYPRLEQHRRQHQQFLEQVAAFRTQLLEGGSGLGHSMSKFLGNWLINHIMIADKAYASFLNGNSGRLPAHDVPTRDAP